MAFIIVAYRNNRLVYVGINQFKKFYQSTANLVRDENGSLLGVTQYF